MFKLLLPILLILHRCGNANIKTKNIAGFVYNSEIKKAGLLQQVPAVFTEG